MTVEFVVPAQEEGLEVGTFLRRHGVSLSQIRSLKYLEDGLLCNGRRTRTNVRLAAGDRVAILLPAPEGLSARAEALPLEIRYRSMDALVVNKPAGMVMHPGPGHRSGTLANAVCGYLAQKRGSGVFYPVGRLDGDTSGLVLCAGHAAAVPLLAKTLEKTYVALLEGVLRQEEGLIEAPLAARFSGAAAQQADARGRHSSTLFRRLAVGGGASLVLVRPHTGRTHQIRAHFAHVGHPLLGDTLYGGGGRWIRRHALHCARIRFQELQGNTPALCCAPPRDMQAAAALLGLDAALADAAEANWQF